MHVLKLIFQGSKIRQRKMSSTKYVKLCSFETQHIHQIAFFLSCPDVSFPVFVYTQCITCQTITH